MTVIIETTDLNKSLGKTLAVDKVNLKVNQGDVYGFLGRNGAGKTTVIKLLMGIIAPDAGTISLFAEPSAPISNQQKNAIGYVPQEQNFYSWMTGRQLADFVGAFYSQWDNLRIILWRHSTMTVLVWIPIIFKVFSGINWD